MDRRAFVAGGASTFVFATTAGAGAPAMTASATDLAGDIRILKEAYTTLHPGLYRYLAPSVVDASLDRLEEIFRRRPSLPAAYLALSRFLASIRCGHTYANFYNQSDAVASALFAGNNRLPFHFRWIDGRMIVTANQSGDRRLARGAEVVSINGVRSARALKTLMAYARADGGNDAKRRTLLEVAGTDSYESFDIFHALRFELTGGPLTLSVKGAPEIDGSVFEIAPTDLAGRRSAMTGGDPENLGWTLAWPQDDVALLTMPSWVAYKTNWDWKGFLDDVFVQLRDRRATGVIIDIRQNEGGNDCGDEIIARLIEKDLRRESYDRRVRYRKTPEALNPHLDTWDPSFRDWGDSAVAFDERFYSLKSDGGADEADVIRPKGPRFTGKVVVLTSPVNSSATFQFAEIVRSNGLATLIGEPTGGNQRGINGGAFFFLRLPASGLEADLPLIGTFPRTAKPDAGLEPDIDAPMTAEAIRDGRDPALESAFAFLRS